MGATISSIGYYLPEKIVSNDELLALLKKYGGENVDLDGLHKKLILNQAEKRYYKNPEETGIDMALKAALQCLSKVKFPARDIDLILYVGMLRDYVEPAMSIILQAELGAEKANAFDISNACMGFLYGMEIAANYIDLGTYQNILIVGAEDGSSRIPWHLFNSKDDGGKGFSALTVSDGAAAMLIQSRESADDFKKFYFKTYGQHNDLCRIKIGKEANDLKLIVKSKKLAITAMGIVSEQIPFFVGVAEQVLGNVDIIFIHQVTGDPRKYCGSLSDELYQKCYNSFSEVGNTGSISIPLGMALAEKEGKLTRGARVAAMVGASGFSFGGSAFVY